jgi:hypothetical protein
MSPLRNVAACLAFVLVLGGGFAAAFGIDITGSAGAGSPAPTAGIGLYSLGGSLGNVSSPGQYSLVIGDAADGSTLQALPGRSLAYFAGTDVNTTWSTGVPYSQALANGWLLTNSSGGLLTNLGYSGNYIGDVGSTGYQQAWIANVLAYLGAHPGLKGVLVDDVLYDLKPMTGVEAPKYPTQQAWAAAQLAFVAAVGQALHAHGYYLGVNASGYIPGDSGSDNGDNTITWWQQLGPYVDGLMNESYQETSDGSNTLRSTGGNWNQQWENWQRLVPTAQSMGKDFIGVMYGSASATGAMSYGKASFLQDWNGGGSVFAYQATDGSNPSNAAWTTDIGSPLAAKQQVGVGWMRSYTGGIALVNPSPGTSQSFSLGGSYRTQSGSTVTSVTLAPTSGAILTAVSPVTTSTSISTPTTTTTTTTVPSTTTTTVPSTTTTVPTTTTTPSSGPTSGSDRPGRGLGRDRNDNQSGRNAVASAD